MTIKLVKLSGIRPNTAALRDVDRNSEAYLGLVDSIAKRGFIGSVSGRDATDPESGEKFVELIDGLHRFTAAGDAGLTEISVDVIESSDLEVLETQILMNIHKVETKPVEYSRALVRMLAMNPMLTLSEISDKVRKSTQWLKERLSLAKLENSQIVDLIDSGKICVSNGFAISKLPEDEQIEFIDRALTLAPDEFVPQVNQRVKELRDAKLKGRDAVPQEFTPVAHMQKLTTIKEEVASKGATIAAIAQAEGITDPAGVIALTLSWVLHLDPMSVAAQKAKDDERRALAKKLKDERDAERAKKAIDKKLEEAAKLQLAAKEAQEAQAGV